jgi:hypothetical protein
MPKEWKFFEVTFSTLSTLDSSLGCLRSVSVLDTLIIYFELWRVDSMKGSELRTFLTLEDCLDMHCSMKKLIRHGCLSFFGKNG